MRMKNFFWEVILFSASLFLGIYIAFRVSKCLVARSVSSPPVSIWYILAVSVIAIFFVLAVSFFVKAKRQRGIIFKIIFVLTIFFGGVLSLDLWLGDIGAFVVMGFLVFWWLKQPSVLIHNICMVLGIAGAGGVLGIRLTPEMVIILLLLFSIYDFIAVYKTKHMVKIAEDMIEAKAPTAFVIPQRVSGFKANLAKVKPGGDFLVLGGGDVVFPTLFCASVVPEGIMPVILVAIFSIIGLLFSFLIFTNQKVRRPMPALPPIALFSIIGYIIAVML